MERIIVLGGGGDGVIIYIDSSGHLHVVHPPRPDELQALVRTLESAVRIEDKGVFEQVAATLGHAIDVRVGRAVETASV
jgi:hypothetical protein